MRRIMLMIAILMMVAGFSSAANYSAEFENPTDFWVEMLILPKDYAEPKKVLMLEPRSKTTVNLDEFQKRPKIKVKKKKGKIVRKIKVYEKAPVTVQMFYFEDSGLTRYRGYRKDGLTIKIGKEKQIKIKSAPKRKAVNIVWLQTENETDCSIYIPTFWDKGRCYVVKSGEEKPIGLVEKDDSLTVLVSVSFADYSGLHREHLLKLKISSHQSELTIGESIIKEEIGVLGLLYNPSRDEWVKVEYGRDSKLSMVLGPLEKQTIIMMPGENIRFWATYWQDSALKKKGSNGRYFSARVDQKPKLTNYRGHEVAFCINLWSNN